MRDTELMVELLRKMSDAEDVRIFAPDTDREKGAKQP